MSWGLYNRASKHWLSAFTGWPMRKRPMRFDTQAAAEKYKVGLTKGKRDPQTNYMRLVLNPRRLP